MRLPLCLYAKGCKSSLAFVGSTRAGHTVVKYTDPCAKEIDRACRLYARFGNLAEERPRVPFREQPENFLSSAKYSAVRLEGNI